MERGLVFRRVSLEKVSTVMMGVMNKVKDISMYNSTGFCSICVVKHPLPPKVRVLVLGLFPDA